MYKDISFSHNEIYLGKGEWEVLYIVNKQPRRIATCSCERDALMVKIGLQTAYRDGMIEKCRNCGHGPTGEQRTSDSKQNMIQITCQCGVAGPWAYTSRGYNTKKAITLWDNLMRNKAEERLAGIVRVIDFVENRCMAADGPVTPTNQEITIKELQEIYKLAGGKIG